MRPDHALELAALPDHGEGGPGAGGGLHRRPEAQRAVAAERAAVRGSGARRRRSGGCVQPGQRPRCGGRRRTGHAPRRRHDLDHRLHPGRRAGGAGRRADRQARRPGTRRQVGQRHPARCRSRARHTGRGGGGHAQRRPVVQRPYPHDRAARTPRARSSASRARRHPRSSSAIRVRRRPRTGRWPTARSSTACRK